MRRARFSSWIAQLPAISRMRGGLVQAPLEPILHASPQRIWWLGLLLMVSHILFFLAWSQWLPQPYENMTLRLTGALAACFLMVRAVNQDPASQLTPVVFTVLIWLELPLFFSWMYLCNGGNTVWLTSVVAMILIYYHVTDWRLATLGLLAGGFIAWLLFEQIGPKVVSLTHTQLAINLVIVGGCWFSAMLLNPSLARRRREHLASTLATISVIAQEMRTPLSTVALVGDALKLEVQRDPDNPRNLQLEKLAVRLQTLVRNVNHQLDSEIANARLMHLSKNNKGLISASQLVDDVVSVYPYQSTNQKQSVKVVVREDFHFRGSYSEFSQVLDNLMKNAVYSLLTADSKFLHGDLRIDVGVVNGLGCITVADRGMGIDSAALPQIFKPFFSTGRGTGHGLGLAFCDQVVKNTGGRIRVKSEFSIGTMFVIELPIAS